MGKLTVELEEVDGKVETTVSLNDKPIGSLLGLTLIVTESFATVDTTFADLSSAVDDARALARLPFATARIQLSGEAAVPQDLCWKLIRGNFTLLIDGIEAAYILEDKECFLGFLVGNNPDSGADVCEYSLRTCCAQLEKLITKEQACHGAEQKTE